MAETAGNKLRRARKLRQLSLEDVARATKIRLSQVEDLETDEYSNFANLAYAKNYLVNYAKYLQVDVRPYLEAFADASTFGVDDYQYLSEKPIGVYRLPGRTHSSRPRRLPRRRQVLWLAASVVALGLIGSAWSLLLNYQRLGDIDKLAARQEARERTVHAAAEAGPQISAPEAPVQAVPAVVPVSAPLVPADATPAPAVVPIDDTTRAAAALALTEAALPLSLDPVVLANQIPASHQLLKPATTLTAGHPADAVHRDVSQPQKVSNTHPRD